ncbi:hypothetical protein L1887_39031 [Cichorium endivia]|nr:hypothetical protein L1887_39031 [Cichorium endivia]
MRCEPSAELNLDNILCRLCCAICAALECYASVARRMIDELGTRANRCGRMAITRSNGGADAGALNAEGSTDENLRNLIAEEVSREVLAAIPQFFGTIKAELWAMLEE